MEFSANQNWSFHLQRTAKLIRINELGGGDPNFVLVYGGGGGALKDMKLIWFTETETLVWQNCNIFILYFASY